MIEINTGRLIQLARPAAEVFVANPEIADVQVNSPRTIYVYGRAAGETTIFAQGPDGERLLALNLLVTPNLGRLRATLASVLPGEEIAVRAIDAGVALTGQVSSPTAAANAVALAQTLLGKEAVVMNLLALATPAQVNLRVRVAEVSRDATKQLGVNWEAIFRSGNFVFGLATGRDAVDGNGTFLRSETTDSLSFAYRGDNADINAVVDALEAEGLLTVLAEPNLTAISGETASFLAGGEFPVPVPEEDDRVAVEFKEFGVRLGFVPTVLDKGRITLRVRPEVSELSENGAIDIRGLHIPALSTRRAETTVELGSGQSLVIAGLLQNTTSRNLRNLPGLSDLPILGQLFRSARYRRNETELVIIITPYLVRPVDRPDALATPLDRFAPAEPWPSATAAPAPPIALGPGGFIVD